MYLNGGFVPPNYSGHMSIFGGQPGDGLCGIPGPRIGFMPQVYPPPSLATFWQSYGNLLQPSCNS